MEISEMLLQSLKIFSDNKEVQYSVIVESITPETDCTVSGLYF